MRSVLLRRMLQAVPLLFGLSALTFLLLRLAPGDFLGTLAENPAISAATLDAMRHRFGLDQPWHVQYALYLRNIFLHLDFGESFSRHQPVFAVLGEGLGNTLLLSGTAALVTWSLAIPFGMWAAARQRTAVDRGLSLAAFTVLSLPEILSGLLLLMLAARTGWFPVGGMHGSGWDSMGPFARAFDLLRHLTLPALVVGLVPFAGRMRQVRANMLDVMRLDYVTAARARGLDEPTILTRHVLRNALNPLITLFGFTLGTMLSGSLVAEILFSWPGLGRITFEALMARDLYLVTGAVLLGALVLVAGNLIADLMLVFADPRLAHE